MKLPRFHKSVFPDTFGMNCCKRILARIKYLCKQPKEQYLYNKRKKYLQSIVDVFGTDCSFITSNCFGGHIYQDLQTSYISPTAGLFFFADDFANFVNNFEKYKDRPINIIERSKWAIANEKMSKREFVYPIGRIEGTDIEVHFLHYHTPEDALNKWKRRMSRVNMDNLVFIGMWQNLPNVEFARKLLLDKKHKTYLFSTIPLDLPNVVYIDKFKDKKECPGPYKYANVFYKYLAMAIAYN